MKTKLKLVTLTALLLFVTFANQASAATLGDKLAAQFCYNTTNNSYTLSTAEIAQWSGQEVSGAYVITTGPTTNVANFSKAAGQDDKAICTKTKKTTSSGSSNINCSKWSIYKSGRTLMKDTNASPCSNNANVL